MEQWQRDIKNSIVTPFELEKNILLSPSERGFFKAKNFPKRFSITSQVLKLINPKDFACPIRLQFIPRKNEYIHVKIESGDPIDDAKWSPVSGIVHRYTNRCLLIPHMYCPAYCRFCFRKNVFTNFCFDEKKSFDYLRKHTEIEEVILSGGEPFLLPDNNIQSLLKKINAIKHVKIVRFHTRLPVTLPSRFTKKLISILSKNSKQIIVVIHVNHPKEISNSFIHAVKKLRHAGVMLLSQSVLLKGVNDEYETLSDLFLALVEYGVKPYYLHQLDRAKGTSHFHVSPVKGRKLIKKLQENISGVCIPRYVVDTATKKGKVPLC